MLSVNTPVTYVSHGGRENVYLMIIVRPALDHQVRVHTVHGCTTPRIVTQIQKINVDRGKNTVR